MVGGGGDGLASVENLSFRLNHLDNITGWSSLRLSESTEEQAVEWNGGDGSGTRATFPALAGLTRAAPVLSRMYCVGRCVYLAPLVRTYLTVYRQTYCGDGRLS
jgi:hypothetical protein